MILATMIAAATIAAAASGCPVQAAAPPKLVWMRDWKAACDLAAVENKLLLICVMKDTEPACIETMEKVYTDSAVAKKLGGFILVPCSISTHDLAEIEVNGSKVSTCSRFRGVLCTEHQALEKELRGRFLDPITQDVIVPHHAVLTADGKTLLDRPYLMRRDGFIEFLDGALAKWKDPSGGSGARPAALQAVVDAIVKAKNDSDREAAARDLFFDVSPEREQAFAEIMERLKKAEDQAVVVRAAGRGEYRGWAATIATQLDSKHVLVRNSTVVSLEEERNAVVLDALVALWGKEKDAETRKDLLRALGPCGARQPKPREILLAEFASPKDGHRVACALSLGWFLANDAEIAAALEARWRKEKEDKVKIAILWGISHSEDAAQVELVDRLVKDERNANLVELGTNVKERLRGGTPARPNDGGGGGGGAGGGGFGAGWRAYRLIAPIYSDDKIIRNLARDFGRGGAGGGGGGR